jgi:hypothetical protein
LRKIENWDVLSMTIVLSLAILPQAGFSQTSTLDKPNLDSTQSSQCVDFNQDKTCEYVVLANGTTIANPNLARQPSSAAGATASNTDFPRYDDLALGISIQHPVGWNMEKGDNGVDFIQQKDIVNFEVKVDNEVAALSDYVNTRLNFLREERQEFSLIESSPTTISGNYPGHKVVYTFVKEDGTRAGEISKVMRIWTIKDAKLYSVAYISELDKFANYLPLAEKMVNSLRIEDEQSLANEHRVTQSRGNNGNNNDDNDRKGNDPCNYYGLNVCDSSGQCDDEHFDCYSDDCVDGKPGTTGQCEGDDDEVHWINGEYIGNGDDNNDGDTSGDEDLKTGNDCWVGTDFIGKDKCDTGGKPLCSENDNVVCFDEKDYPQTPENMKLIEEENEARERQGIGCQPEDDYCDYDQNCEWTSIDCIDDVNPSEGDSKETATGDREYNPNGDSICSNENTGEEWRCGEDEEEEESNSDSSAETDEETENCGGEPCTPTEKEDSTVSYDETEGDADQTEGDADTNEDNLYGN